MGVVAFLEGTVLSQGEWTARLSIRHSDFKFLVDSKVLRAEESSGFRLTFVGVVVFQKSLLFAQPKFGEEAPIRLPDVLRILRTYFARRGTRRASTDRLRDPEYGSAEELREFDALVGLRDWYFAHGVYRAEKSRASSQGRPHWVKTIAMRNPLFVQGSAVYPSIIADRREGVLNEISGLQLSILRHLSARYGMDAPSDLVHAEQTFGSFAFSWPLSDDQRGYSLRRLAVERRGAFRSDTLHLFSLLKGALESRSAGMSSRPTIFGTTAFYAVWEDACRVVFGGAGMPDPIRMVGHPVWFARSEAGSYLRFETTQIPDIIIVRDSWYLIIDAKYYYPFPHSHPGAPDIVKQFYYRDSLSVQASDVISVFMMPLPGATLPRFLGLATIEGAHREFGNIEAWGVDPRKVLAGYVSTLAGSSDDFLTPILAQRSGVAEMIGKLPANIGGE